VLACAVRTVAISADPHVRSRLSSLLDAEPAAQLDPSHDGALLVVDASGDIPKVRSRAIFVVRDASLTRIVELFATDANVVGVVRLADEEQLRTLVARVRSGEVFSAPLRSADLHRDLVTTYADRAGVLERIRTKAQACGASRGTLDSIEQCADELLVNALFDAPVDVRGAPLFSTIDPLRRTRIAFEQRVSVEYGGNGESFALVVRDGYGTLLRPVVARVLQQGVAAPTVGRSVGGAGLGFFLIASSASQIEISVLRGIATQVTCCFALGGKPTLGQLAFLELTHDTSGTLVAAPRPAAGTRFVSSRSRRARPLVALGAVSALGFIGAMLVQRARVPAADPGLTLSISVADAVVRLDGVPLSTTHGAHEIDRSRAHQLVATAPGFVSTTLQIPADAHHVDVTLRPSATLSVATVPVGAMIRTNGKDLGTSPLTIEVEPEQALVLEVTLRGFAPARVEVGAIAAGKLRVARSDLVRSSEFLSIHVESTPSGARITGTGVAEVAFTPADVIVAKAKHPELTLSMPGHKTVTLPYVVPEAGTESIELRGELN